MGKNSAKQTYVQLTEWLETRTRTAGTKPGEQVRSTSKFSKADTYNKSRR